MDLDHEEAAEELPRWARPERALLLAIIERAVQDLAISDRRDDAIEWLTQEADENDEFTLPWLCEQLDLRRESMEMNVAKIIEETASGY